MSEIIPIVLAAGKGTRMYSNLPKVLHPIGGKPMLQHVVDTALKFKPQSILVVIGHGAETVRQKMPKHPIQWVLQEQQLGTGHAVKQAMEHINSDSIILILYGDVPLISFSTLEKLVAEAAHTGFSILSAKFSNPFGYGRIIRDSVGNVIKIAEQKDATEKELQINEINTGIMAVNGELLRGWLKKIENNNAQQEYYLTDIVEMAVLDKIKVHAVLAREPYETKGINDRKQQAKMERFYQKREADKLLDAGVSLIDPKRLDIRGQVETGKDVVLDINVILEGEVTIGDNVKIGANSIIKNSKIAANTNVLENCVIEDSLIGENCNIGPFARIRPGTELKGKNNVGNFVEVKKSSLGQGSKVNHLSYIGDTEMGEVCNIGAGTITCNYDGAYKHQTIIGNNVFVGSDTQLVAPVRIDDDVTIGAGSTITRDIKKQPQDEELLVLGRNKQITIKKWRRPKK